MGNDLAIQTVFLPLSEAASAKMQQIIDKGGYPVWRQRSSWKYEPQVDERS